MKKYKDFISEGPEFNQMEGVYKPAEKADIQQYKSIFFEHLSYTPIFRGMEYSGDLILGDGSKMKRQSHNTMNIYTEVIDKIPSWKRLPKRSNSFICSTDIERASMYKRSGHGLYLVIPLENQIIGSGIGWDFWFDFEDGIKKYASMVFISNLHVLNKTFVLLFFRIFRKNLDLSKDYIPQLSLMYDEINKMSDEEAKKMINNLKYESIEEVNIITHIRKKKFSFLEHMNKILDPKLNDIKGYKHKDLPKENQEVWLSGKVLFLEHDYLIKLQQEFGLKKSKKPYDD